MKKYNAVCEVEKMTDEAVVTYKCEPDPTFDEHWWHYPMYIQYHPTFYEGSYLLVLGLRSPRFLRKD